MATESSGRGQNGQVSVPSPGTGYFIAPAASPGPALLLLHSWWGLTQGAKLTCDELADLGYTVLAPDLNDGEVPSDVEEARRMLAESDVNVLASLIQSSLGVLRRAARDPEQPAGVIGYGSGASWALWLSARSPDSVDRIVTFCGSQNIGLDASNSRYLCHFAEHNPLVTDLDMAELGLALTSAQLDFRMEHHEGTTGGFADRGDPAFDGSAEAVAWRQSIEFLAD